MIVYTFVSNTTKYLPIQVYLIKKYIPECTKIVGVIGPFDSNREMPASLVTFVYPKINDVMDWHIIPSFPNKHYNDKPNLWTNLWTKHIVRHEEHSLILEGDCFPIRPFDSKEFGDYEIAGSGRNLSWLFLRDTVDKLAFTQNKCMYAGPRKKYGFVKCPHGIESYDYFLHLFDQSRICKEIQQEEKYEYLLDLAKSEGYDGEYDNLCSYDHNDLVEYVDSLEDDVELDKSWSALLKRFNKERKNWKKHGKPVRSAEEMAAIYDDHCSKCEHFDNNSCGICGCLIKRERSALDLVDPKNYWGTTRCPLKKPRWVEMKPEYELKDNSKGGGCGNCPNTIKTKPK